MKFWRVEVLRLIKTSLRSYLVDRIRGMDTPS